jgi:hypothetical protein
VTVSALSLLVARLSRRLGPMATTPALIVHEHALVAAQIR